MESDARMHTIGIFKLETSCWTLESTPLVDGETRASSELIIISAIDPAFATLIAFSANEHISFFLTLSLPRCAIAIDPVIC